MGMSSTSQNPKNTWAEYCGVILLIAVFGWAGRVARSRRRNEQFPLLKRSRANAKREGTGSVQKNEVTKWVNEEKKKSEVVAIAMSLQNGGCETSPKSTLVFFVNGKSFNSSHFDKCVNVWRHHTSDISILVAARDYPSVSTTTTRVLLTTCRSVTYITLWC